MTEAISELHPSLAHGAAGVLSFDTAGHGRVGSPQRGQDGLAFSQGQGAGLEAILMASTRLFVKHLVEEVVVVVADRDGHVAHVTKEVGG